MQHERHWSVDEANAALGWVAERVERLRERLVEVTTDSAADAFATVRALPGGGYPGRELAAAGMELAVGIHELERRGIVVRDLQRGLIDFPSLRDGEEVYLCWVRGEPTVAHWHRLEAGFAGRQPL